MNTFLGFPHRELYGLNTLIRVAVWLVLGISVCSCNRYPHTNIYDPAVSGNKYEVILSIIDAPIEEFDCGNSERCFYLVPVIQNSGPYMADFVELAISVNDPIVSIRNESSVSYGQILPGGQSNYTYHFQLAIPPNEPTPHATLIYFEITESSHGPWLDTLQVTLQ